MDKDFQIKATLAYLDVMKSAISLSDECIAKEMIIRAEILNRDFTKRQLNIIWFIFTYSYPMGKDKAVFHYLQDFEQCGVDKTKVRAELDKLKEYNVIEIDESLHLYGIKDVRYWTCPHHNGHNEARTQDIFLTNLRDAGVDIEDILKKLAEK